VIEPLSEKLEWWLSTVLFLLWHIEIVDEDDEFLSDWWAIYSLSSFLEFIIKVVLSLVC